jgi:hypothetical protein
MVGPPDLTDSSSSSLFRPRRTPIDLEPQQQLQHMRKEKKRTADQSDHRNDLKRDGELRRLTLIACSVSISLGEPIGMCCPSHFQLTRYCG